MTELCMQRQEVGSFPNSIQHSHKLDVLLAVDVRQFTDLYVTRRPAAGSECPALVEELPPDSEGRRNPPNK